MTAIKPALPQRPTVPPKGPFDDIVEAVVERGYAVCHDFLPTGQIQALLQRAQALRADEELQRAGIGRGAEFHTNRFVRQDRIHWLSGEDATEQLFLEPMAELRLAVNRALFMGLFDYEAHFALYPRGAFYKKHVDAFHGRSNRRLSTVLYLNFDWQPTDGGALRFYAADDQEQVLFDLPPTAGTLVVFDSERFWHEVLPAQRERFSIAGWFRINTSTGWRVDPPT